MNNFDKITETPETLAKYVFGIIDNILEKKADCTITSRDCPEEADCMECYFKWLSEEVTDE